MTRVSLRIPVLTVVLALVACGSDDGNGGSSGSGGAAGAAGAAGASGSGGSTVEPAKMVQLPAGFWIDSTEVTQAQYAAWLETNPSVGEQPATCSWNAELTPSYDWAPTQQPDHPVVGVDWCDAYAYCQGVGKRLCGKFGGGPNEPDDANDPTKSEWYYACTSDGANDYPYGDTYDPNACVGKDASQAKKSVGSFPSCQSTNAGFSGVYDLSGNVSEWVDLCVGTAGGDDFCATRGGYFALSFTGLFCYGTLEEKRSFRSEMTGIRCCKD